MKYYNNPLNTRYASKEMSYIFSDDFKFKTWRLLWVSLAKNQQRLGLDLITNEQINAMEKVVDDIDFALAHRYEQQFKHDVMAHIHCFGDQAPSARAIIHLGVTSAFVQDNTNLVQIKKGLELIRSQLVKVLLLLCKFANKYADLPTLGFTHFQPAQLTTVGKRATLWAHSLFMDLKQLDHLLATLEFRGVKGTTGTQASFANLFENDYSKVIELDKLVAQDFDFKKSVGVCGQTYDRKQDTIVLQLLANIAASAHKFTNDFRLLQHLKELEEPFAKNQIGSSAMAYKRNPMRCERISSLAKFVMANEQNGQWVSATQWFERTLDDSANKRLSYPQSFLAIDAILNIYANVIDNCVVYEKMIRKHIDDELPFMLTENIMMQATKGGADRQVVHEIIREASMRESYFIKHEGQPNRLIEHLLKKKELNLDKEVLEKTLDPSLYTGFSAEQTRSFIQEIYNYIGEIPTSVSSEEFDL
ncbi:adenylosuccinate lyase [Ureaplasma sp. ES3154-GEN]|uniref:adenylosuccinate lyase n=1 Tax=Ureaplasma sp. ES3154-GEN TaxID=2984844 RepID=UPI0021E9628C|nr:adenylosuccinate lyase [Ureaplasma sp. ES3154-GEN]MCV3743712.1 adenylosuccinate lyase [Ureaplasma sp. ES3154-GEN]